MKSENLKFLINTKVKRLEVLNKKGVFSKTFNDSKQIYNLNEEIEELEKKLLKLCGENNT